MSRSLVIALVALGVAALPAKAGADGLPVPVEDTGPTGIADGVGVYRYVSLRDGRDTFVARTVQNGGAISRSTRLHGEYTIPAVGVDGSASGLSGDGKTLVLIRPRRSFPRPATEFVVLGTKTLDVRDRIKLDGDFSFDAVSPNGRTMYLIHYTAPVNYTRYEVRAFDLAAGHLLPGAIVDPNEDPDEMRGLPLSRETSPSGRWAYTLYMGGEHPFVHALDTVHGAAVCVDLDDLENPRDYRALGLSSGPGQSLTVTRRGEPAALVNTESFAVSPPPAPGVAPAAEDGDGFTGAIWAIPAAGIVIICGAAIALALRRRRSGAIGEPAL